MNNLSPQRRKVVILAGSVSCMSASGSVLFRGHPRLILPWLALVVGGLVYTISELVKLKRGKL